MPQVDVFLDVVAKNADFFRKLMLKYGEVRKSTREGDLRSCVREFCRSEAIRQRNSWLQTCSGLLSRREITPCHEENTDETFPSDERRVIHFRSLLLDHVLQVQACDAEMPSCTSGSSLHPQPHSPTLPSPSCSRYSGEYIHRTTPCVLHEDIDRLMSWQTPHSPSGMLRIEDLIFGFIRLASCKYQKLQGNLF